jgi:hypothetical protein
MKAYIETDEHYLKRVNKIKLVKLESIHSALQELQQEFNIPDDHEHLENAFKLTEDLREEHLEEQDQ